MTNLTPDLYNAGSNIGAAGYGAAAYSEQGGTLSVNPSSYNAGCGGDASLASKATVGGGKKRKSKKTKKSKKGKSKKAKKAKKSGKGKTRKSNK